MRGGVTWLTGALCVLALPGVASAHLDMTSPVSRYGAEVLKSGPCGVQGGERTSNISYFEPGATIEVRWYEYVDHPSHYRIAFDEDGHDDFVDPATMMELYSNDAVLIDGIEDHASFEPDYSVTVELPDVECDNCTLQLIQVMYDKPPYEVGRNDIYYQCADLVLKSDPPPNPEPGTGGSTGSGGAGGDSTDPDPSPGPGTDPGVDGGGDAGGCQASNGDAAGLGLWLIFLVAVRRLAPVRRFPV